MKTRKVALIILFDNKRRILIQDRRGISKLGEEWGYFGGQIEAGETPEQAVRREAKEELSITLTEIKHLTNYSYETPELKVEATVFITPVADIKKLNQKEGKSMKFFTLSEARNLKMVCKEDKKPIEVLESIWK